MSQALVALAAGAPPPPPPDGSSTVTAMELFPSRPVGDKLSASGEVLRPKDSDPTAFSRSDEVKAPISVEGSAAPPAGTSTLARPQSPKRLEQPGTPSTGRASPPVIENEPRTVTMSPTPSSDPPQRRRSGGYCVDLCLLGGVALTSGPCVCGTVGSGCVGCCASLCICPFNYAVGALWGLTSCCGKLWGPSKEERAEHVYYIGEVGGYHNDGEREVVSINGKTTVYYVGDR
jgi:hypothetical protein